MRLHMLRNLEGAKVSDAIADGFELNSKDALPKLQARLDQLAKMIPDVKEGDEIALTWIPDKGTERHGARHRARARSRAATSPTRSSPCGSARTPCRTT